MSTEIDILKRRLEREKSARKQAEAILEAKAKELYEVNQSLEVQVKERTAALEKSEQQYRSIVENAEDIIYNIDSNGNFSFVNPAGLQYTGYELSEVIGKSFSNIIRDDYKEKVQKYYLDVLTKQKSKTYYEFPIVTKQGSTLWIGQNVKLNEDSTGNISFSVLARDITKRKITEAELIIAKNTIQKSELKYRSIMENMMLGLLEVDNEGRVIKAYPRFCEMVGYPEDELIGKQAEEILMVDEDGKQLIKLKNQERQENNADVYETNIRTKEGKIIDVLISAAPFHNEYGEIVGSIGIHYDITERKTLSKELEKAKLIAENAQMAEAQFLANMSHEMRTPLNAIIGMSHLLQDAQLNNDEEEYLDILSYSANVLQRLISDVLDISKIDAGKLELQAKPFDLHKLIRSLEKTFAVKLEQKNVKIKTDSNLELEHLVIGDELILNQIFLNLLGNAEKFTKEGEIIIKIEQLQKTEQDVHLRLAVSDTGIGMTDSQIQQIFEQFKQASSEIRKNYGGTGLGLAITKKLIQLLDSKINVESEIGQGSTFSFEIKFDISEIPIGKEEEVYAKKIEFSNIKLPVLIVEDNAMNQKYITRLFEKWKLNYHLANNGAEAVELSMKNNYCMVFMDLQMPVMNGYEATEKIRKLENSNAKIPIIALTASTLLSKKQHALNSGMSDFLSKPFNPKQLSKVILSHLHIEDKFEEIETKNNSFEFNSKLDGKYLNENYQEDLDYCIDLMDTFLESVPKEVEHLQQSVQSKDFNQFAKTAHKLKPTFTMVGYPKLTAAFETLELDAKIESTDAFKSLPAIEKEIGTLIELLSEEKIKLETHLKNLST